MAATVGSLRIELSASIAQFQADMGKAASAFKATAAEFTKAGNDFKRVGGQIQGIGLALSKTLTLPLVAVGGAVAKVGIDFETAFAGVRKTVDGAVDSMGNLTAFGAELQQGFRDLAKVIPISVNELAKLGETAGALGIPRDAILDFSRVMAELGVTTNLTADQAATAIAHIQNQFNASGKDTERFASTLVALGNAGASTESEILELAARISGAGKQIGLSQADVLGFANALASLGVNAEAGGTATSTVFIEIAKAVATGGGKLTEFAGVAGKTVEQFSTAFKTDAAGAIVSFLEGLQQVKASGGNLFQVIDDLGLSEKRLRDELLRVAGAGKQVSNSLDLSRSSWQENTALTKEAEQRFKTTASQLTLLGNRIADVGITLFNSMKPGIDSAIQGVNALLPFIEKLAQAFGSLPGSVQLAAIGFLSLSAAIGPVVYLGGQVVSSMGTLIGAFGKTGVATRAIVGSLGFAEKAMQALGSAVLVDGAVLFEWGKGTVAVGGFIGKLAGTLATLVSTGLGPLGAIIQTVAGAFAALLNPVTLIVGAFAGVTLAVIAMTGHWDDFKAGISAVLGVVQDAGTVLWWLAKSVVGDLISGLADLGSALGSGILSGFRALGGAVVDLAHWLGDLASQIAGPLVSAFASMVSWIKDHIPTWLINLVGFVKDVASATKDLAVNGAQDLHDYADAVRGAAASAEGAFTRALANIADYRKAITDRALPAAALEIGQSLELLKSQLAGISSKTGGSAFDDLTKSLAAARAELDRLSQTDISALTAAVKSGAFSMKDLQTTTGLSEMALKLFEDRVKDGSKSLDHYADSVRSLRDQFSGANLIADLKKLGDAFGSLPAAATEDIQVLTRVAEAFSKLGDEIDPSKLPKDLQVLVARLRDLQDDVAAAERAERIFNGTMAAGVKPIQDMGMSLEQLVNISRGFTSEGYLQSYIDQTAIAQEASRKFAEELKRTRDALATQLGGTISLPKVVPNVDFPALRAEGMKSGNTFVAALQSTLARIPDTFKSAFTGGGGVLGALKSILVDLGSTIGSILAAKIAGAISGGISRGAAGGQGVGGSLTGTAVSLGATAVAGSLGIGAATAGTATAATLSGTIATAAVTAGVTAGISLAVIGGIALYKKLAAPEWKKLGKDIGRDFGVTLSDETLKSLAGDSAKFGRQAVEIFNIDKIISAAGGLNDSNIKKFTGSLHDTFSLLGTGSFNAAQAALVLDTNFQGFADHWLAKGPLISKDLVEIVRLTNDLGVSSKAVSAFISQQVTGTILPGLEAYAGASKQATAALVENQKKLADLQDQLAKAAPGPDQERIKKDIAEVTAAIQKEQGVIAATGVTSQAAADALSASVAVAFAEMMKAGTPILDIVNKLEPVVAALGEQFAAAGFSGGTAFQNIQSLVGLAADEIAGPALQATIGLGQALAGLSNIGQLNQQTFSGLSDQIAATFTSLVAQGKDGNQVLALMQGPLQTIWQLSTEFGYAVDDGTKALLDQALAAGVVGERFKGPQQQVIDALAQTNSILGSIATALGATLPAAAQTAAAGITTAFSHVNPQVNVDINYNDPGFTPDVSTAATGGLVTPMGVQRFAFGGLVRGFQSQGTDTVPAMLTPGEVVLNQSQQAAVFSAMAGGLSGRESLGSQADLADSDRSSRAAAPAAGEQHFHFNIQAVDQDGLRRLVTRPGGLAEMVMVAAAQGKHGLDEKFRRALRVPNG